jgi:cytochrome bd-type quinol oxidase subunit 1
MSVFAETLAPVSRQYLLQAHQLSPRLHLLSGIPVVVAGVTGSLFVISVNGFMLPVKLVLFNNGALGFVG